MLDLDASDRLVPATGANRVKIGLNNVVQPSRPNSDSNSSSFDDLGDFQEMRLGAEGATDQKHSLVTTGTDATTQAQNPHHLDEDQYSESSPGFHLGS